MKILTLGPEGTYSHLAALRYDPLASISFAEDIGSVFSSLSQGTADIAVLPLQNSLSGIVESTWENLNLYAFPILDDIFLPVTHHLSGFGRLEEGKSLLAHSHAYQQCRQTLQKLCPHSTWIEVKSNADSACILKEKRDPQLLAIVSPMAAELYSLPLLKKEIQDREDIPRALRLFEVVPKIFSYDKAWSSKQSSCQLARANAPSDGKRLQYKFKQPNRAWYNTTHFIVLRKH